MIDLVHGLVSVAIDRLGKDPDHTVAALLTAAQLLLSIEANAQQEEKRRARERAA